MNTMRKWNERIDIGKIYENLLTAKLHKKNNNIMNHNKKGVSYFNLTLFESKHLGLLPLMI